MSDERTRDKGDLFNSKIALEDAIQNLKQLNSPGATLRSRELSEALTCIETGMFWLNKCYFNS